MLYDELRSLWWTDLKKKTTTLRRAYGKMFNRSWFRSPLCIVLKLEEKEKTCKTGVENRQTWMMG